MPQIFRPGANLFAKVSVFGGIVILAIILGVLVGIPWAPVATGQGVKKPQQPVPYYHVIHVGSLQIDCRYCHTSVEVSSFANIPASQVCMNCHKYVLTADPQLDPIRASLATGQPVKWTRVNQVSDFAYFDHSIHVNKGIGCSTCHGRIDQMTTVNQVAPLYMEWCLSCHRHPEKFVRQPGLITQMDWQPPQNQATLGPQLVKEYGIESKTSCSTCHR